VETSKTGKAQHKTDRQADRKKVRIKRRKERKKERKIERKKEMVWFSFCITPTHTEAYSGRLVTLYWHQRTS
jgi:hypothetical protein